MTSLFFYTKNILIMQFPTDRFGPEEQMRACHALNTRFQNSRNKFHSRTAICSGAVLPAV